MHKRRVRYVVGGCTSEVSEVIADGQPIRTIAIESEDAEAVVAAVRSVGLKDYLNTDYGRGLARILEGTPPRYAVIGVGTNSVKFHVGERRADGSWRRVIDRAEMCRLGEGLEATGRIGEEPLERTIAALKSMVAEARSNMALAIVGVGTAVFRVTGSGALAEELATLEPATLLVSREGERTICLLALEGGAIARFGERARELAATGVLERVEAEPHL